MKTPGKKVGKLRVKLDRAATRYKLLSIEVDLRLDVASGKFYALYEGQLYGGNTKDELADKVREAATKTIELEWTRYLVVDYEARAWPLEGDSGRPESSGSYESLSIDDDRAGLTTPDPDATRHHARFRPCVVTSIDLHWLVCEISNAYPLPEDKTKRVRMRREVDCKLTDRDDDGRETYEEVVGTMYEQDDDKLPRGAVPWTAEREALLREVLVALGKLDARMVELFRGDPDSLARQLDAVTRSSAARLLVSGDDDRRSS